MALRQYQVDAVEAAAVSTKWGNKRLISLATGTGKSHVIAGIVDKLRGAKTLILQPSKEILMQNAEKLKAAGIEFSINSASLNKRDTSDITLATIGSVFRDGELIDSLKDVRLLIVDEAHNFAVKGVGQYNAVADYITKENAGMAIGLTATPYKMDKEVRYTAKKTILSKVVCRLMEGWDLVYQYDMAQAMRDKNLSQPTYIQHETAADSLRTKGLDYSASELNDVFTFEEDEILAKIRTFAGDKFLVFTITVDHAEKYAAVMRSFGKTAAYISGSTKKKDREKILKDFSEGRIKYLFNVGVLTTGYDLPDLDNIILLRPTQSVSLYVQMIGRVVRKSDKPKRVFDFAGNYRRFGKAENIIVRNNRLYHYNNYSWQDLTSKVFSETYIKLK